MNQVDHGDEQRPCARGDRCAEAESINTGGGRRELHPALGYRAFCDTDRGLVLRCLEGLPGHHAELGDRIGDKVGTSGPKVSGSKNAPVPINLTVDELRVDLDNLITSWAERVYEVAHLVGTARDFARMCEILGGHLDALLALPAEPMTRFIPLADADDLPDGTPIRRNHWAGYAQVVLDLSGADAGLEILRLNARCRWILGHTGKDQKITGRCFSCDQLDVLVRPDSAAGLADHAECSACGTRYFGAEYAMLLRDAYETELAKHKQAS